MYNMESLRGQFIDVELAASFLDGTFTLADLEFYLVARHKLHHELRINEDGA